MKEHPILFSEPMVKAILEGRKTQTRRIIKSTMNTIHDVGNPKMLYADWPLSRLHSIVNGVAKFNVQNDVDNYTTEQVKCPYGQPGDRLWVRESCAIGFNDDCDLVCDYMADGKRRWFELTPDNERYAATYINDGRRPSIFMPRWASRITLEITKIRAERLQEISEMDAVCEGIDWRKEGPTYARVMGAFADLWDSINAKRGYGWNINPWLWVIEFNKV